MKPTISKSLFLNAGACSTLGWRIRHYQVDASAPSVAQQFRMEQGSEIGRRAQTLFPLGVLISKGDLGKSVAETNHLIQPGGPPILFEPTFMVDDYVAKADVLIRSGKAWKLLEVKMNTSVSPRLIDDLAYTLMVATHAGLSISKASLLLISKTYRVGMPESALFEEHDCTPDALSRMAQFNTIWDIVRERTSAATMPPPKLKTACKSCDLFSECVGKDIKNHIFDIPRLSDKKFEALREIGVNEIEAIPEDFKLSPPQERIRQAIVTGKPWSSPDLKDRLSAVHWPVHYLDFETMTTALPLYPETAPYTQIPTQYSIHRCHEMGQVVSHKEFISDPSYDGRRNLAERLIADLEDAGSVVTYSNFERTTIGALANLFPDLAAKLGAITDRIFDLEAVIRDNYYHPDFHGRTSVKATLPALVSDMSYSTLNIKDGDSASATFALMAMGRYDKSQMDKLTEDLLTYCAQDTLAMVKLHERLYDV